MPNLAHVMFPRLRTGPADSIAPDMLHTNHTELQQSFGELRAYVRQQFAGPAASGRVEQFERALSTLEMLFDHLHEEAARMENYRYDGHNIADPSAASAQRIAALEAELDALKGSAS